MQRELFSKKDSQLVEFQNGRSPFSGHIDFATRQLEPKYFTTSPQYNVKTNAFCH